MPASSCSRMPSSTSPSRPATPTGPATSRSRCGCRADAKVGEAGRSRRARPWSRRACGAATTPRPTRRSPCGRRGAPSRPLSGTHSTAIDLPLVRRAEAAERAAARREVLLEEDRLVPDASSMRIEHFWKLRTSSATPRRGRQLGTCRIGSMTQCAGARRRVLHAQWVWSATATISPRCRGSAARPSPPRCAGAARCSPPASARARAASRPTAARPWHRTSRARRRGRTRPPP